MGSENEGPLTCGGDSFWKCKAAFFRYSFKRNFGGFFFLVPLFGMFASLPQGPCNFLPSTTGCCEDFPYALNGLIPLAAASNDPRLKQQCYAAIARVLETAHGGTKWWRPVFFLVKLDGTLLKTNMIMENQPFWIKREFAPENKPRLRPLPPLKGKRDHLLTMDFQHKPRC